MIAHEKERFEMAEKRERSLSNTMIFIRLVLYLCQSCVVDPSLSLSLRPTHEQHSSNETGIACHLRLQKRTETA